MTINQLSVFIENKSGKLLKVLNSLKEANIQILATTIADTPEYGICRIICDNPELACKVLRDQSVSVNISKVFALMLDNQPGAAATAMQTFADEDIDIKYFYAFHIGGKGVLLFRTNDEERTRQVITVKNLPYVCNDELAKMQF